MSKISEYDSSEESNELIKSIDQDLELLYEKALQGDLERYKEINGELKEDYDKLEGLDWVKLLSEFSDT